MRGPVAAIEGGGTKFRVVVGIGKPWTETPRIATRGPEETLADVVAFLRPYSPSSIGVAMFGPLNVTSGTLYRTPKAGWSGFALGEELKRHFDVPTVIDTDVNVAAFGEAAAFEPLLEFGDFDSLVYWTLGTGIGAGAYIDRRRLHGSMHPELGHARVRRDSDDTRAGICPFHGDCLEGLASGTAINADVASGTDRRTALARAARYVGRAVALSVFACSPTRVVVGGGVIHDNNWMLEEIKRSCADEIGDYLPQFDVGKISLPRCGEDSALSGAFLLATLELVRTWGTANAK